MQKRREVLILDGSAAQIMYLHATHTPLSARHKKACTLVLESYHEILYQCPAGFSHLEKELGKLGHLRPLPHSAMVNYSDGAARHVRQGEYSTWLAEAAERHLADLWVDSRRIATLSAGLAHVSE